MFNERFNPTPVIIEWFDINATDGGWHSEEDIKKHEPAKCIDLCFIYSESDERVITFSSYNLHDDGAVEYGFITAIPTGCIRKITKL